VIKPPVSINNSFYDTLGPLWQTGENHPVAFLRAENKVRNPWILSVLQKRLQNEMRFLDIGCGGGLLTNYLAENGVSYVEGIDLSQASLDQAKQVDATGRVIYRQANALCLPHKNATFDAVAAMDILEHVERPLELIQEAARVLKPGGLFFFHTFNRTFASWLTAIKGLEWCGSNAPKHIHIYRLFLHPDEVEHFLTLNNLQLLEMRGLKPVWRQKALWQLLLQRKVSSNFRFTFSPSLSTGYCGFAVFSPP